MMVIRMPAQLSTRKPMAMPTRTQPSVRNFLSADMFTIDEQLEDLKERVLIHANSRRSLHRTSATPAVLIWNDLLPLFSQHAANIDPDRVLAQDPMLILGELCDLSDECVFDWGYDGE